MYSQFIFEVITFLSKIQDHSKKSSNYGNISKIPWKIITLKNWIQIFEGKTTTLNLKLFHAKEIQIILRLFLVHHLLLDTKSVSSQPASNVRGLVIHWTGLNWLDSTKWWLEITYVLFQFPYSTQYLPNFGSANLKLLNSIAIAHRLTCMQQIRNAKRTKGIYEILSLIYNVSVWAELNLLLCFCLVYKLEGVKLTCWLDYSFEIEALSIWFWT